MGAPLGDWAWWPVDWCLRAPGQLRVAVGQPVDRRWWDQGGVIGRVEIAATPRSRHAQSGVQEELAGTQQVHEVANDYLVPLHLGVPAKLIIANLQVAG